MSLAESVAPETGAKPTLPEGVDRVVLNQQLELVFGGDNPKLEKRIRRNAANMVAGRGEARRGVDDSLDKHEAGKKAQELALIAGPAVFGAGVYVAEPNRLRLATESLFISGALIGPAVELTSGALKMLETRFPKLSGVAKLVSGVRSKAHLVSQMSVVAAVGFMGAGIVDALTPDVIVASGGDHAGRANLPPSPDRDLRGQPDVGKVPFGGVGPNDRGSGVDVVPQQPSAPDMPPTLQNPPVDPSTLENFPKENFGQQIDVQQIVDSLPKHVGVAQLPESQQLGTSHWRLAEAWSDPLSKTFGLSEPAKTFFTDAVKDMTQNQGNIKMDTVVSYDKQQIGDYLAQAVARLKETDPAGWQVKVSQGDLERLQNIAGFLKNSK
jgi:hypothetical protein